MNILKKLKKEITNKLKEKPKIEDDNFEIGFDTKYSDNQNVKGSELNEKSD